jgi:myo-inositol-1(or 4)-monophosphatase
MLVTGFPYDVHDRVDEIVGLFGAFVGEARAVRRLGSAAIDLCFVAAGRMDGFWERDLKPWDVAGGALIVQEAGGRVTHMDGAPFASRGGHVLATNALLHDASGKMVSLNPSSVTRSVAGDSFCFSSISWICDCRTVAKEPRKAVRAV